MSKEKNADVVVFGDLFLDLVMSGFQRLPELGQEALASHFHRETGGGAAHTSCGLAILGLRTKLLGAVGAAEIEWFRKRLGAKGVDLQGLIVHHSEPTATTVAVSTSQERVFYTYAGANRSLPELLRDSSVRECMAAARHVHFAHLVEAGCLHQLSAWLHEQGCTVSIDVGWDEEWLGSPRTMKALREVDWFLPNEQEAKCASGQSDARTMLQWFEDHGLRGVVIKLGPEGAIAQSANRTVLQPAYPLQPVETTGAGDCFDAGFLFAWLKGRELGECLAWGNICGGMSTQRAGGIDGFPNGEEVERALQQYRGRI